MHWIECISGGLMWHNCGCVKQWFYFWSRAFWIISVSFNETRALVLYWHYWPSKFYLYHHSNTYNSFITKLAFFGTPCKVHSLNEFEFCVIIFYDLISMHDFRFTLYQDIRLLFFTLCSKCESRSTLFYKWPKKWNISELRYISGEN